MLISFLSYPLDKPYEFILDHRKVYGWPSLLFQRIHEMGGLNFSRKARKLFTNRGGSQALNPFGCHYPFDESHLEGIEPTVKHLNILEHSGGIVLRNKASLDPTNRTELLKLALQSFQRALQCNPSNKYTLRNCAEVYIYSLPHSCCHTTTSSPSLY